MRICDDTIGIRSAVVVGGGASGTLAALHLLHAARLRRMQVHVVVVERTGVVGPGVAYGTTDPAHLLNAPAGRMSAVHDDPDHLLRWCDRSGVDARPSTFLRRNDYGRYLIAALAEEEASAPPGAVVRLRDEAVAVSVDRNGYRVRLASGGFLTARTVVLALGSSWAIGKNGCTRYFPDVWSGLEHVTGDRRPVLLIGSGLTAVDAALSLHRKDVPAIHMISRHALLPQSHHPVVNSTAAPDFADLRATTATGLVRAVRRTVREHPGDWREVVDALRPCADRLWAGLEIAERQRLIVRFGRFWEVHRHRMPQPVARQLAELHRQRRLHLHRGRLLELTDRGDHVEVLLGGHTDRSRLRVGWVLDCTGPRWSHPLVTQLERDGLAVRAALGLGVGTDAAGRVLDRQGRAQPGLLTLGPPRRGGIVETTAIPEIRRQAADIARHVLSGGGHV